MAKQFIDFEKAFEKAFEKTFEKAFEIINRQKMWKIIKKYGLPDKIINMKQLIN